MRGSLYPHCLRKLVDGGYNLITKFVKTPEINVKSVKRNFLSYTLLEICQPSSRGSWKSCLAPSRYNNWLPYYKICRKMGISNFTRLKKKTLMGR
jgi:hypothetical protein